MNLLKTTTIAQAWVEACSYLFTVQDWTDTTLVLHVSEPSRVRPQDRSVRDAVDLFLGEHEHYSIHTVAETIFPGYEYRRRGVDGVYRVYPEEIYPRIKELPEVRRWGTYAHRLLRRLDERGNEYNPLEACIQKMRQKKPVRAAYEIGFGFGFDLATYSDDQDRSHRMGGPCLSHLSFKLIDGSVHLTAMYRYHYYIQRAYGNLLGLARLQSFVANQIEAKSGPLVCHSTLARLEYGGDDGWNKGQVTSLIRRCESLIRE